MSRGSELFVGLDIDAVGAIVEIEIIHVHGTHVYLQSVRDLIQRDAEGFGAFAVEVQDELRIVGAKTGEQARDSRILVSFFDDFLSDVRKLLHGSAALILEDELEAAELSEPVHSWRGERDHLGTGNGGKRTAKPFQNRVAGMLFAFALVEVFKASKDQCAVRSAAAETESSHGKCAIHLRYFGENGFDLRADSGGVFERRTLRSLNGDNQISAVFRWDETLRNVLVDPVSKPKPAEKHENRDVFEAQHKSQKILVSTAKGGHAFVEGRKNADFHDMLVAQENRRKRGREGERIERGNGNGKRDGERKLAEQDSGGTGEECHRNEDRYQNKGSSHNSAGYFLHGDGSGVVRFGDSFGDMALYVFDDDDRIIHHKTSGKGQTEERKSVDREAQNLYKRESSDEGNGNRDRGNKSAAPILQEDENHQHDEDNCLDQRVQHVLD